MMLITKTSFKRLSIFKQELSVGWNPGLSPDLENLEKALNFEMDLENLEIKKLTVENLKKLSCFCVLFRFIAVDLRKNKDQEEKAIKL